ncbi:MAG TPA: hypothetical protein VH601_03775 [Bryobacteraceae bacterium]|jgi:hypothetical protein
MDEQIIGTTLPILPSATGLLRLPEWHHSRRAGHIVGNECWAVVRTVAAAELEQAIHEMELSLDVATAKCPHSGAVHLAPGFSELFAFVCDRCGEAVQFAQNRGT